MVLYGIIWYLHVVQCNAHVIGYLHVVQCMLFRDILAFQPGQDFTVMGRVLDDCLLYLRFLDIRVTVRVKLRVTARVNVTLRISGLRSG